MECLYAEKLSNTTTQWTVEGDEFRHARALRLRIGNSVILSNGTGLCATAVVQSSSLQSYMLEITALHPNHNELPYSVHCAIGTLDDKERMEWLIEKAVELGVSNISFLATRYSSQTILKESRLLAKSIAAMKQCKRAILPAIRTGVKLDELLEQSVKNNMQCILASDHGASPALLPKNTVVFIGPEGGFDETEMQKIQSVHHISEWRLGASRLRAETAALAALSYIASQFSTVHL
ncbi:MAG: 16S rRNA (uracil(1498)-N(3))-methyltransferase [Candidatus Kapabacteria bacterium]|nr:16S rRNA (uracil(1498)-N(3))-methyltransferase [Candidatus Kapabacteria bacterium]